MIIGIHIIKMDSSLFDDTALNEILTGSARDGTGRSIPKLMNIDTTSKPFSILATFYCMKFHEKLMINFIDRIFGSYSLSSDNVSDNKLLRSTCLTLQKDSINSLLKEDQIQTLTRICKDSKDLQQFGKISRSTIFLNIVFIALSKTLAIFSQFFFFYFFSIVFSAKFNVFQY